MARAIRSVYGKIRNFLNGQTTRGQVIPPYLLIGLLWWISIESDARERAEERVESEINIAEVQYIKDLQLRDTQMDLRKDCLDDANGRNNNITNWQNLFDFLRSEQSPGLDEFAARLEFDFNNRPRNRILDPVEYCRDFPEPGPVEIPKVLIEHGIVPEEENN